MTADMGELRAMFQRVANACKAGGAHDLAAEFERTVPSLLDEVELYRWLKDQHNSGDDQWFVYGAHTDNLDDDIREAIRSRGGEGEG